MKTLLIGFTLLLVSLAVYPQKMEVPIRWKAGDVWTYDLKKREHTRWTDSDERSRIGFKLKILSENYGGNLYEAEWQYLSYKSPKTDSLKDTCALVMKKFLLQTPFRLKISKTGEFKGWIDFEGLRKKMSAFADNESKKLGSTLCNEYMNNMMNVPSDSAYIMYGQLPEIRNFFEGFSLLKTDGSLLKDTLAVMPFAIEGKGDVPKVISRKVKHLGDGLEVSFTSELSRPHYKKFYQDQTRIAAGKMGMDDESIKRITARMKDYKPTKGELRQAVFDKKSGTIRKFLYQQKEGFSPEEDEVVSYEFVLK